MPELPDIAAYISAIGERATGRKIDRIRLGSPFLVRTADPPMSATHGKRVLGLSRIGKRIVFELEDDLFMVVHLMIAGRFHWKQGGQPKLAGKIHLASIDIDNGSSLLITEASTKKRASIHLVRGRSALEEFDRGGLEILTADREAFEQALRSENHTLKRALTDPRLFSGVGNAFSDEILHRARLSPGKLTTKLDAPEAARLYEASRSILTEWIARLSPAKDDPFPEKVTAFRPEMAVHGKYNEPCPVCGSPVQRIVYADNESNYCATCQTGGRLLADRSMSRLLKSDWPRTLEELEESRNSRRTGRDRG